MMCMSINAWLRSIMGSMCRMRLCRMMSSWASVIGQNGKYSYTLPVRSNQMEFSQGKLVLSQVLGIR